VGVDVFGEPVGDAAVPAAQIQYAPIPGFSSSSKTPSVSKGGSPRRSP
jgi:hypothetical protein